ncbi:glycosyltransferase family 2 protein [Puia sp.]|uniref:glycosyltransferase family 2 protein n=1 Tax=Puia sp. TaxID=2045100 RepID=UPI002F41200A
MCKINVIREKKRATMILSVIIVNYRVKYFLELCLHSVGKAIRGLDAEIIVVDNHSGDDSLAYLGPRFPGVKFLASPENVGFARANNLALGEAKGEYILFLNPDTILPEDAATHCLAFLRATPRIGGLGVRMIDGGGHFLKESRRGFPTPWVGFCKLTGLAALFPRSRFFSGYYLGYLPADAAHPAPVLSGACLWVSRAILGEVGSFDEQFFLYAEDIDLSFRIGQAGYANYYTPGVTIVHFKGESTRKDIAYVRQFYRAMRQFRRKHFNKRLPAFFNWGIQAAIRLREVWAAAGKRIGDGPEPGMQDAPGSRIGGGQGEEIGVAPDRVKGGGVRIFVRGEAEEVLLCEGERFSFREGIGWLEENGRAGSRRVWFHAAGSDSAVGSPDRNDRGTVFTFEPSPGEQPLDESPADEPSDGVSPAARRPATGGL